MYIIIVGGGRIGVSLARLLIGEGHDVVIIEKDKNRAESIAAELDALVIYGDGTDIAVLKDAGINRADMVLPLTDDDKTNLMIAQLAKNLRVKRIIARVNQPENEEIFLQSGVDTIVSPTAAIVNCLKNAIDLEGKKILISIGGGKILLLQVVVDESSELIGKKVNEIKIPSCKIVAIDRNGDIELANENSEIHEGDILFILAKAEALKKLNKLIKTQK